MRAPAENTGDPVDGASSPPSSTTGSSTPIPAETPTSAPRPSQARQVWVALRTWADWKGATWLLVLPGVIGLVFDLVLRGGHLLHFSALELVLYVLTLVVGSALWGSLLAIASRRGALGAVGAFFVVLFGMLAWGCQGFMFRSYTTYLGVDALNFGLKFLSSVRHSVSSEMNGFLRWVIPPAILCVGLVLVARRVLPAPTRPRRAPVIALVSFVVALLLPVSYRGMQASSPELISIHALSRVAAMRAGFHTASAHTSPGRRSPEFVPTLASRPERPRNVVFLLNESVRADVVCVEPNEECKTTPFSNRLTPHRLPLKQMRALDSTTFISIPVLFTGLLPTASWDEMHSAPTVWEYAMAAGWDSSYWTSQNLEWGETDVFLRGVATNKFLLGKDIAADADYDVGAGDHNLAAVVARDLPSMQEPFFAVIQLANTHFPYWVEPTDSPFQPSAFSKAWEDNEQFQNFYKNSVHFQDRSVAEIIKTIRGRPGGDRTVIVYTSDHGEAFREHAQMAHTFSQFDEEVKVPMWIDAPPGTLSDSERAALESLRDLPVTHADMLPTFLDLMGLWDAPQLAKLHSKLAGQSLLRAGHEDRVLPMTNCASLWSCPFKNWGMIRGPMKLEAREWDPDWHCWNVLDDPRESRNLGVEGCGDLPMLAGKLFGELPNGRKP